MTRKKKMYPASAIDQLLKKAREIGYEILTVEEGTLGHGITYLIAPTGYYNYIIEEHYINCWNSGHTVSRRKNITAKMRKNIDRLMTA